VLKLVRVRRLARLRILLPAAVCALAGHAVAYGTFWPSGPAHGYFGWYEPLLGGISLACLLGLAALLPLGFAGSRRSKRLLGAVAPSGSRPTHLAHRLALTSLAILLVQETLEASLSSGRFVLGGFSGTSLLLLLAFLWLAALALTLAARTYAALAHAASRPPRQALALLEAPRLFFAPVLRSPSPLAACRALRAPPRLLPA
jgi:hypothetical protein